MSKFFEDLQYAYKYYKLANYTLANTYYKRIEEIFNAKESSSPHFIYYQKLFIRSLIDQSKLYRSLGDLESSMDNIFKVRDLCEQIHYKKGLYLAYTNLYHVYLRLEEFEYAFESINKSIEYIPNEDEVYYSNYYTNLAFFYQKTSNYTLMESCLEKARYRDESSQLLAKANTIKAYAEMDKENYVSAVEYLEIANDYYREARIEKNIFANLNEIAKCYEKLNQLELATEVYSELLAIYDTTQLHYRIPIIKSLIDLQAENTSSLSRYQKLLIEAQEQQLALDHRNAKEVLKVELRFNENMLMLNEQKTSILKLKKNATVAGLLFVIILIILLYRYQHGKLRLLIEKQTVEHELDLKSNQLNSNLILLSKRNEELDRIQMMVEEMQSKDNQESFSQLKNEIHVIKSNDNDWVNYIRNIDELDYGFINIIKQKGVNLSKSEVRMLVLSFNGYNAKEIANILKIESKSVDMARYRLRKKLSVPKGMEIQDFLKSLC